MDREFSSQLDSCRTEVIALCRALLWHKADLEDAVQEVIVQALHAYPRFEPGTHFRAWLLRVAAHTVYNLNRKRRRVPLPSPEAMEATDMERELGLEEAYEAVLKDPGRVVASLGGGLRAAVERLNETERAVFLLRSLGDLKYHEIAETLEIPLGSVMGNLGRARAKLRKALAGCVHEV